MHPPEGHVSVKGYRYAVVNKEVKKMKLAALKVDYDDLIFVAVSFLWMALSAAAAGMGADLYESYCGSILATAALGAAAFIGSDDTVMQFTTGLS